MPRSILDAIKQGDWNFEPNWHQPLDVLAERLRQGLPLWHPSDRLSYDDYDEE